MADIKFDDHQVLSASFDNTIACWEYESGTCWTSSRFSGIIIMETNNSNLKSCLIHLKSTLTPGVRRRLFFGHVGAVFSVDYAEEIDLLVSGSADMTVKLWSFSTGILIYSQHVYTEWVTKVVRALVVELHHQSDFRCGCRKRRSEIFQFLFNRSYFTNAQKIVNGAKGALTSYSDR